MMQLRDTVEIFVEESPGEDSQGNPLPPTLVKVADSAAHVYYSTTGLNFADNYDRMIATEQLRAIIPDPGIELQANKHRILWRGVDYRVDGVMHRVGRGKLHHITLDLHKHQ